MKHVSALLALSLSAATAHAQDSLLTPMVVTATRIPTELSDVVAPLIVIQRDEIERSGVDDLAQLLRFHAGVDIGRNGGPGQTVGVFMRGAESNHTLVLLDGVRLNPGTIGGAALQNINPSIIERVEILKGPRSSLYGSDAIGGVINVITRKDASEPEVSLALGGGQFGTRRGTLSMAGGTQRSGVSAVVNYTDSDGFPTKPTADFDAAYDSVSVNLNARQRVGEVETYARLWRAEGSAQYADFFDAPLSQDYRNETVTLGAALPLNARWNTSVDISRMIDDIEQNDSTDFAQTERLALDLRNTIDIGSGHTLLAGIYAFREDADSLVFGGAISERVNVIAAYVEDSLMRGPDNLSWAVRHTDNDAFGGATTWHVDYGRDVAPGLTLTAGVSTGFRAPDATDRFGFGGNPDLEPETSRNVEVGLKFQPSPYQQFGFSAFALDIDDLITFEFDPQTFFGRNENIETASVRGLEARYQVDFGTYGVRAEAVVQRTEDERSGEPLPRRARRSLSVNGFRRFERGELGVDVLATSARKDSAFSDQYNAGYVLVNIGGRMSLSPAIELRGRLENVFDVDYQTAAGFNTPGRGLYLDVVYTRPGS